MQEKLEKYDWAFFLDRCRLFIFIEHYKKSNILGLDHLDI